MNLSFAFEEFGELSLLVSLHTARKAAAEWPAYERQIRAHKQRVNGEIERLRTLAVSDGGAPGTHQRSIMQNEIWEGRPMKVAVLTNALKNPVVRGIATALGWMNPGFKIYDPSDLRGALLHLELPQAIDRTWECLRRLQAGMPKVATLGLIADALGRPHLASQLGS